MLYIPLPILIRARLPLKRKLILCGVFSLGFLVILSAILNRYYNFTAGYGSLVYLNWYMGEAATSVFVANVPHLWPLLSRVFSLGAFNSMRRTADSNYGPDSSDNRDKKPRTQRSGRRLGRGGDGGYSGTESEEGIANAGARVAGTWPLHSSTVAAADDRTLEMGPLDNKGVGYSVITAGGGGGPDGEKGEEPREGIVRTVHIRQYSS